MPHAGNLTTIARSTEPGALVVGNPGDTLVCQGGTLWKPAPSSGSLPTSDYLGQTFVGDGAGGWFGFAFPVFQNAGPIPDTLDPTQECSLRVNSGFVGIVASPAAGKPFAQCFAPNGGDALLFANTNEGDDNDVQVRIGVHAGNVEGAIDITVITVGTNGTGVNGTLGFYNTGPIERPTVSGVSADPVVASIVAALAGLGLVIDGT